jgi:hypothetical protein
MQAAEWSELFAKFPAEYQEILMLATNNGVELAVQQILRMDENYVLIRGRLGGTTDANRIFVVPYHYLSFVYFTQPVSNERLKPVFGDLRGDALEPTGREHEALDEVETQEVASRPEPEPEGDLPKIDVSTLQPQVRPAASGPKSVAASLRERLLRTKGGGPRQ